MRKTFTDLTIDEKINLRANLRSSSRLMTRPMPNLRIMTASLSNLADICHWEFGRSGKAVSSSPFLLTRKAVGM
jgi:hypothetical protein